MVSAGELTVDLVGDDQLTATIDGVIGKFDELAQAGDTATASLMWDFQVLNDEIQRKIDHVGELIDAIGNIPQLPPTPAPPPAPIPPAPPAPIQPPQPPAPVPAPPPQPVPVPVPPTYTPPPNVMAQTHPGPGRPARMGETAPPGPTVPAERTVWSEWVDPMHPEMGARFPPGADLINPRPGPSGVAGAIAQEDLRRSPMEVRSWGLERTEEAARQGPNVNVNVNAPVTIQGLGQMTLERAQQMRNDPNLEEAVRRVLENFFRDYYSRGNV